MKDNNALSWVTSIITIITGVASEDIIRVVLLVLGCISTLVSLSYNIYCWWKKAKADGKITADEIKEGVEIVDKHIEEINNITNKEKK